MIEAARGTWISAHASSRLEQQMRRALSCSIRGPGGGAVGDGASGSPDGSGEPKSGPTETAPAAEPDWSKLIGAAPRPEAVAAAQTFHKAWGSASKPVCVKCSDGIYRVLKAKIDDKDSGRGCFNDQVIARLAQKLGAPVPPPSIVILPKVLVDAEPNLKHMPPGPCHASEFRDHHSDRMGVANTGLKENRPRFASLAVLYGWMHASDHQVIYPNDPPPLVLSVDHGHFIGNGSPAWTPEMITARPYASADQTIVTGASLTQEELVEACKPLATITAEEIAEAVGAPPEEWGVSTEHRVALAKYLWKRRTELLTSYAAAPAASAANKKATGE